jgi:undecaprenyl-diphosphatase
MTAPSALALGIAGIIALVPGASRVGMVILVARALGYERAEAARFGFMLSIPVMFASGPFGLHALAPGTSILDWQILTAAGVACLATFAGMASLVQWVSRERFTPLAVYGIVFGATLLYWLYG